MTKCLPESVFVKPVTETPEGKAFLAKYPNPKFYVDQMCLEDPTYQCSVEIVSHQNSSFPEGVHVKLDTQVNVTSFDNPNITIGQKRLACVGWVENDDELRGIKQLDVWTVKGDIIQNLQPENPDCWELGPPPRPADDELVRRAKDTEVGRAYLESYPDNTISIRLDNTLSNQPEVIFTPTVEDRIKYGVTFSGLDWNVDEIWVACSNGNQTWYRHADEHDFWTYFQPEEGNCRDYPPSNL